VTLISEFDPWRSQLCTCPPKLTLNPYTGCDHTCAYCYASSYIPRFHDCRPKRDLVSRLRRECRKLEGQIISMSNSSDPYPNLDSQTGLTRQCLEVMATCNCKIQLITKSTLVTRDIDILKKIASTVSMTITTEHDALAKLLEPNAPPPSERLKAVETLIQKGIPTSVRIDPIIPFLNDNPEILIKTLSSLGVEHVTGSTYKMRPDNWRRLSLTLPETAQKLRPLYFSEGEKTGGGTLLPRDLRLKLMKNMRTLAERHGMKFGTCRENMAFLNTASCDGSWLIGKKG
jgi:DNA repair photolyase